MFHQEFSCQDTNSELLHHCDMLPMLVKQLPVELAPLAEVLEGSLVPLLGIQSGLAQSESDQPAPVAHYAHSLDLDELLEPLHPHEPNEPPESGGDIID